MLDTNWWEKFENWCLWAGILLSVLNLSLKWGFSEATINNWLIDYLLIKLYLGEILLLLAVFAVIMRKIKKGWRLTEKQLLFFALEFFAIVFLSSLTKLPFVSLFLYGQIALILIIAVIVREKIKKDQKWKNWLIKGINGLIGGESLLAFYQLVNQKNWLPYSVLGETNLQATHDLVHGNFFGKNLVLPYGTLAHPNILAGTIVILLWWLWQQTSFEKWWQKVVLGLGLSTIFLTQSVTAGVFALGLLASVIIKKFFKEQKLQKKRFPVFFQSFICLLLVICIPLLMARAAQLFPENDSIVRRARLNQVASSMWQENPLFGVGMGQFVANLNQFWPDNRFTQPVHNIFLLFLAENGIVGFIWLLVLFKWLISFKFSQVNQKINKDNITKNRLAKLIIFLSWVVFLSLDHYLLTSFWGLLVWLIFI